MRIYYPVLLVLSLFTQKSHAQVTEQIEFPSAWGRWPMWPWLQFPCGLNFDA